VTGLHYQGLSSSGWNPGWNAPKLPIVFLSREALNFVSPSVYKDSICLATPPRIVCNSRHANTCSIYFDIWNSQTGFWMKSFVNHSFNMGGMVCFFCKAFMKIGTPLCICCFSWGYNTNFCNSSHVVCPICNDPHHEDNYHALAACCKSGTICEDGWPLISCASSFWGNWYPPQSHGFYRS